MRLAGFFTNTHKHGGAADGYAVPAEPDAEALIQLAQELCEGLGLQPAHLRSTAEVVPGVRTASTSAETAATTHSHDLTIAADAPPPAGAAAAVLDPSKAAGAGGGTKSSSAPQPGSAAASEALLPQHSARSAAGSSDAGDGTNDADSHVDSLDALLAERQWGPPTLQRLAAEALLPAEMQRRRQELAPQLLSSCRSSPAAVGAMRAAGCLDSSPSFAPLMAAQDPLMAAHEMTRSPSLASSSCDVCAEKGSGCCGAGSPSRPASASASSGGGCSICAARQGHAGHVIAAGGVQASIRTPLPGAPPAVPVRHVGGRIATADCSAQTVTTADAASGPSQPGAAAAAAVKAAATEEAAAAARPVACRKRKPAAMSGGKRLCVPASGGTKSSVPPPSSGAAAAPADELPWSEQLRRPQVRQQPRADRAGARKAKEPAGAAAAAEGRAPSSPEEAPSEQRPDASADDDLSRRMSALEAKVASWSLPQVTHVWLL